MSSTPRCTTWWGAIAGPLLHRAEGGCPRGALAAPGVARGRPRRARRGGVPVARQIARVPRELLERTKARRNAAPASPSKGPWISEHGCTRCRHRAPGRRRSLRRAPVRGLADLGTERWLPGRVGLLRCAGAHSPFRRPASFTCHFLGVADFTDVELTVRNHQAHQAGRVARGLDAPTRRTDPRGTGVDGWRRRRVRAPRVEHARRARAHGLACRSTSGCPTTYRSSRSGTASSCARATGATTGSVPAGEFRQQGWYRFRPTATFVDPYLDAARSLLILDTMLMPWPTAAIPRTPSGTCAASTSTPGSTRRPPTRPGSSATCAHRRRAVASSAGPARSGRSPVACSRPVGSRCCAAPFTSTPRPSCAGCLGRGPRSVGCTRVVR